MITLNLLPFDAYGKSSKAFGKKHKNRELHKVVKSYIIERVEWIKENDLPVIYINKLKELDPVRCFINEHNLTDAVTFLNEEDAMAFKLRWL